MDLVVHQVLVLTKTIFKSEERSSYISIDEGPKIQRNISRNYFNLGGLVCNHRRRGIVLALVSVDIVELRAVEYWY